jgi:hypothetical protein
MRIPMVASRSALTQDPAESVSARVSVQLGSLKQHSVGEAPLHIIDRR